VRLDRDPCAERDRLGGRTLRDERRAVHAYAVDNVVAAELTPNDLGVPVRVDLELEQLRPDQGVDIARLCGVRGGKAAEQRLDETVLEPSGHEVPRP
jgi:hypothetical protein